MSIEVLHWPNVVQADRVANHAPYYLEIDKHHGEWRYIIRGHPPHDGLAGIQIAAITPNIVGVDDFAVALIARLNDDGKRVRVVISSEENS